MLSMFPPPWFLPLDIIFQLVTAIVCLIVAAFAFRGYQWIGERSLMFLYAAFSLLAAAFFLNGITMGYALFARLTFARAAAPFVFVDLGFWLYFILQALAYILLAYAYHRRLKDMPSSLALIGGSLLFAAPLFETLIVLSLFIIVAAQVAHYMTSKSRNSWIVTRSFLLILISQILILFGAFFQIGYVSGKIIQLVGFLSLLALLYRLRGPV